MGAEHSTIHVKMSDQRLVVKNVGSKIPAATEGSDLIEYLNNIAQQGWRVKNTQLTSKPMTLYLEHVHVPPAEIEYMAVFFQLYPSYGESTKELMQKLEETNWRALATEVISPGNFMLTLWAKEATK